MRGPICKSDVLAPVEAWRSYPYMTCSIQAAEVVHYGDDGQEPDGFRLFGLGKFCNGRSRNTAIHGHSEAIGVIHSASDKRSAR